MVADLGGEANCTRAQKELIARAAMLSVLAADIEARYLAGEEFALDEYAKIVNASNRVLNSIGLERRAKNVTPSLDEYAERKRITAVDAEEVEE
jgi:hypothetical protein